MQKSGYTIQTISYTLKNLWYIILLSVLPAASLAVISDMQSAKAFYGALFSGEVSAIEWFDVFETFSIFSFRSTSVLLLDLVGFLLTVFSASMLMAMLDKHMRIGKRTLNGIVEKINDNIASTLLVACFFAGVYELWTLIFSSLTVGLFSVDMIPVVQYVFFVAMIFIMGMILLYAIAVFYTWLPCMQITGYRPFEALRYTNQITENIKWRIVGSMIVTLLLGNAIIIAGAMLLPTVAAILVKSAVWMFFFMFFVVRMDIVYFDASQTERSDIKTGFFD